MTRMLKPSPTSGFTLVELMVTIAVLAVIAMMAAPSFIQTIRKNQLNNDTREFVNLLTETRSEAIFKQNNRTLTLNGSGGFKNWGNSGYTTKNSGDNSVTFNRLGQSTIVAPEVGQCFVFKHNADTALTSEVYVQKGGTIVYNKTATSCPPQT